MATTTKAGVTTTKKTAKAAPTTTRTIGGVSIKPTTARKTAVGSDQRRNYIEVAAYYIAERRGFIGGNAIDDWAAAEAEVDQLLLEGKLNR